MMDQRSFQPYLHYAVIIGIASIPDISGSKQSPTLPANDSGVRLVIAAAALSELVQSLNDPSISAAIPKAINVRHPDRLDSAFYLLSGFGLASKIALVKFLRQIIH